MALETSYTSRPAGSGTMAAGQATAPKKNYWPLEKLRKCYTDYLFSKREEIDEQIDARRYYHGSQYTQEQITALRKRRQPIMTFNRVSRKIDGVVGILEAKRQDPKAYPRTPQHEEGADLATAVLRYVLDDQDWEATSPICAMTGAVDGIGGVEIDLIQGDKGDPEISLEEVEIDAFFYDPRSHKPDFSDARYMGVGRWLDDDIAKDMFPDADENAFSADDELTSNSDREARWFRSEGVQKRVRVVEIWYRHEGGWCWAVFSGNSVLKEGQSPFKDDMGKDYCKYIMFAGFVDQDGDKYGFVRNLKSPQDGINAKQSKMQHILASKRIILSQGSVDDIEKVRAEWARPDGVVITNRPVNEGVKTDDQSFDFAGWVKMLELNQAEIENFGPNRTLLSEGGVDTRSGRAIAMLRQSGEAELGPFMLAHRGWKIRLYRAIFWAVQQHWTAERYIRVTDDEGLAQFIQINGLQIDPTTGQPTMVNAIGQLDVDIILDEGPDTINMMQDLYETLSQIVPAIAPILPPPKVQALADLLVETSPIDAAAKKRFRDVSQQPAPPNPEIAAEQAKLELKAKEGEQNMALKERESTLTMAMKAQEHAQTMQFEREKHAMEMQREDERCAMEANREDEKGKREMAHKTVAQAQELEHKAVSQANDIEFDRQKNAIKIEGERAVRKEQTSDPTAEGMVNSAAEALNGLTEGITKVGEQLVMKLEGLEKAFLAPTKLVKDKQGRPIAAEKVKP